MLRREEPDTAGVSGFPRRWSLANRRVVMSELVKGFREEDSWLGEVPGHLDSRGWLFFKADGLWTGHAFAEAEAKLMEHGLSLVRNAPAWENLPG